MSLFTVNNVNIGVTVTTTCSWLTFCFDKFQKLYDTPCHSINEKKNVHLEFVCFTGNALSILYLDKTTIFASLNIRKFLGERKSIICIFNKLMPDNSNFIREAIFKIILRSITGFYCISYST